MSVDLENEIIAMERELLDLKTSQPVTSSLSMFYWLDFTFTLSSTSGKLKITYDKAYDQPVFSQITSYYAVEALASWLPQKENNGVQYILFNFLH